MLNVESKNSQTKDSLNVFAKVSINELFWHAGASEDFTKKSSQASSSTKTTSNLGIKGGPQLTKVTQDPKGLGDAYNAWSTGLAKDPTQVAGIKMVWRNWYDLEEV